MINMNLDVDISKFVSHGNIGNYAIEFDSGGIYFSNLDIVSASSGEKYNQVSFDEGATWNNFLLNEDEIKDQYILLTVTKSLNINGKEKDSAHVTKYLIPDIISNREASNKDIVFCNINIKHGLSNILNIYGINALVFKSLGKILDISEGDNEMLIVDGQIVP